jgi:hypothetical protein
MIPTTPAEINLFIQQYGGVYPEETEIALWFFALPPLAQQQYIQSLAGHYIWWYKGEVWFVLQDHVHEPDMYVRLNDTDQYWDADQRLIFQHFMDTREIVHDLLEDSKHG